MSSWFRMSIRQDIILSSSSLMASRSTTNMTNLTQEILSKNWLGVFVDGKLKSNKLEARNTE